MENHIDRVKKTLKHLNTFTFHPQRKLVLRRMETNKRYSILSARRTIKLNKSRKTVIRLDFDDFFIYLPKRFEQISDSIWNEISDGGFEICKLGSNKKTVHLQFSCNQTAAADKSHQFSAIEYLNNYIYSPNYKENESYTQSTDFVGQSNETFENFQ